MTVGSRIWLRRIAAYLFFVENLDKYCVLKESDHRELKTSDKEALEKMLGTADAMECYAIFESLSEWNLRELLRI